MFSTLVSALLYLVFRLSSSLPFFLKKPRMPFCCSSLASKLFSSPMRLVIISPTSPRSLVDTLARAASEKSPIFFWQAEPYCSTCWLLVISIFSAKESTIACSSGVSCTSGCWAAGAGSGFFSSAASGVGSSVRVGTAGASRSKLKLLSAISDSFLSNAVVSVPALAAAFLGSPSGRAGCEAA